MDRLPVELLTNIFENLFERHLQSVALVCKQFSRLVQPLMYAQLVFQEHDLDAWLLQQSQLLRTLITRPDLAQEVEYPAFRWWYADDKPMTTIGSLTTSLHAAAEKHRGTVLFSELSMQLGEQSPDAVAALVLAHLPRVKTLRLGMVPFDDNTASTVDYNRTLAMRTVEAAIVPPLSGGEGILSNLNYIMLDGSPGNVGFDWDIRVLSLFLRLPSLRMVVTTSAHCTGDGCWLGLRA